MFYSFLLSLFECGKLGFGATIYDVFSSDFLIVVLVGSLCKSLVARGLFLFFDRCMHSINTNVYVPV